MQEEKEKQHDGRRNVLLGGNAVPPWHVTLAAARKRPRLAEIKKAVGPSNATEIGKLASGIPRQFINSSCIVLLSFYAAVAIDFVLTDLSLITSGTKLRINGVNN
jgi:hypothetical protein